MRIHAQEIFKRNLQFILFVIVVAVSIFSSFVSTRASKNSLRPIIIGIDSNGTRIVSDENDPIYKTEAINFIKKFAFNTYNFDPRNFIKRLGFATTMMSDELWKNKQTEVLDLKNKVERDQITLKSEILKLTRDESGVFHGLIEMQEQNRLNIQTHKFSISLKLKVVPRTTDNPFGLEVDSYEENLVHD